MIKVKRHIKVVLQAFSLNMKERLAYPIDFLIGALLLALTKSLGLIVLGVAYFHVDDIVGYSFHQTLLIFGLAQCSFSLWTSIAINTISVPYYIADGTLDRFFIRPYPVILQILLDGFDEDAWGEFVLGSFVVVYAVLGLGLDLSIDRIALLIFTPIVGGIIYLSLSIIIASFSFLILGYHTLDRLLFSIKEYAQYPIGIFPSIMQNILKYIIPLGYAGYFPARFIMNKETSLDSYLQFFIFPVVFLAISLFIWKINIKKYQSTGS